MLIITKMKELKIGDLTARVPIIQGGMGVNISLSRLSAAVANEGGIGVIATASIGMDEPDFYANFLEANMRSLLPHGCCSRWVSSKHRVRWCCISMPRNKKPCGRL